MDFKISPDDRIGGETKGRKRRSPPGGRKPPANARVEPGFGGASVPKPKARGAKPQKRPRREKKPFGVWRLLGGLFYWLATLSVVGALAVAGIVYFYWIQMPSVTTWAVPERAPNIRVVAADGRLISNRGKSGGEAVSLHELPAYVPAAFVAIEDRRFYEHFGIDVLGLASVAVESVKAGEITRGASTITQQVAKNLFLKPDQELGRKVQEALLALWLEHNYSKDQILELYLNRVNFGHERYGVEAAAQYYFGKSARNLALGEVAILAGSLQAPSRLNPKGRPDRVEARQRLVLGAMAKEGYISTAEATAAKIDPGQSVRTKIVGAESYVADWVEGLVTAYVGNIEDDVIVHTTIDWEQQKHAEFLVKEAVRAEGGTRDFTQGALVAIDTDGAVRAVVGGTDYQKSQYNRAVTSRRQPGSTFKPFVYAAAMEAGYTPETAAEDAPINIKGWKPDNADGKFLGKISLREALAYSRNTVAAQLATLVGPEKVVEVAQRLGISSPLMAVASIALGTQEVSLLELTAAYAPFANGGNGVIASIVTRVTTADGKVLFDAVSAGPGRVLAPKIVGEMNDMLGAALAIGTGKRAQLPGWQIAGKTGTSQKARDALFIGYSARLIVGVWLGNDDDRPTKLAGGSVPTQIWSDFMAKAHRGLPPAGLPDAGSAMAAPSSDPIGDLARAATAPPAEPPPESRTTIGDLITSLFAR